MDHASSSRNLVPVDGVEAKPQAGKSMLETVTQSVADKLHTAADIIQKNVEQNQGKPVARYAAQASAVLGNAADYIREIEPQKVKADLQKQIRSNPGRSLMVAGAAGLLLGILIRRR